MPVPVPIESSYSPAPTMTSQPPQMNSQAMTQASQMTKQTPYQMSTMQIESSQMGANQFINPPQMYPYCASPFLADINACTESSMASCQTCHFFGMTRVERRFSTCQFLTGFFCIFSGIFIIPGILILILARDYEHTCTRCQSCVGKKKAFC